MAFGDGIERTTRSSEGLDERRRRLLFRAWHRGMREIDLIMGRFADAHIATLSDAELDEFERLLDVPRPGPAGLGDRRMRDAAANTTRRCSAACATFIWDAGPRQ